uniref:Uncharacterized protein n=1 Tax=viral metagenome TaxID=1070528 RepID=A0A6C0JEE5_9ZZZZ
MGRINTRNPSRENQGFSARKPFRLGWPDNSPEMSSRIKQFAAEQRKILSGHPLPSYTPSRRRPALTTYKSGKSKLKDSLLRGEYFIPTNTKGYQKRIQNDEDLVNSFRQMDVKPAKSTILRPQYDYMDDLIDDFGRASIGNVRTYSPKSKNYFGVKPKQTRSKRRNTKKRTKRKNTKNVDKLTSSLRKMSIKKTNNKPHFYNNKQYQMYDSDSDYY